MFEVIFEVRPRPSHWESYLATAASLKPILQSQRGFLENVRYGSLTRPGWLLSLSDWEDEKALIRWRTQGKHHNAQDQGRTTILEDYHLRVGEVQSETGPNGTKSAHDYEQKRFDETETGEAKALSLVKIKLDPQGDKEVPRDVKAVLEALDFRPPSATGLVSWDAFEAILTPGDIILLCAWSDANAAERYCEESFRSALQIRQVRVIRDYGMSDRAEAPQYYPDVKPTGIEKSPS